MEAQLRRMGEAFTADLAHIRARHGSAWAVFFDQDVVAAFATFAEAADFAFERFGDEGYLIRHTYQEPAFAPFFLVR